MADDPNDEAPRRKAARQGRPASSGTDSRAGALEGRDDPTDLARRVLAGDRRALARAITLIESVRDDHRAAAETLLGLLLAKSGRSIRIGVSGAPGVGKSTFIEAFGLMLIEKGHRVGVLAVDPSSERSGGSILGDKTRMEKLSVVESAFIRPSPAGGTLGGVARRSREAMIAVEAAGFDVVLIETVGVGQSETAVARMTDLFMLLIQPGGGDDLQGLKRGIVELADLLVVTKADGDLKARAERAVGDYGAALHLLTAAEGGWTPRIMAASAVTGEGMEAVWRAVGDFRAAATASGAFAERRRRQGVDWMWDEVFESLKAMLRADPEVRAMLRALERQVTDGAITPTDAAGRLLAAFMGAKSDT